jgi:hypothetical protein
VQGGQIGRIFASWATVYFGQSFLLTEAVQCFWAIFPTDKGMHNFDQKIGCATFWATFSQTHLVTLILCLGPPRSLPTFFH